MEKRKKDGCETSRNRQKKETGKRNRIVLLAGAGIVAAALLTGGLMHGCREKIPTMQEVFEAYLEGEDNGLEMLSGLGESEKEKVIDTAIRMLEGLFGDGSSFDRESAVKALEQAILELNLGLSGEEIHQLAEALTDLYVNAYQEVYTSEQKTQTTVKHLESSVTAQMEENLSSVSEHLTQLDLQIQDNQNTLEQVFSQGESLGTSVENLKEKTELIREQVSESMKEIGEGLSRVDQAVGQTQEIWYNGRSRRGQHYDQSRYHCLNLHSVFQKGTVEFRLFNGTLHAGKIKAYIQFCLAVTAQALNQTCASRIRTETTNEKYTFRTWLLRLGLNGKEFETARYHLLKNLPGCIAWRDPAQAIAQQERLRRKRAESCRLQEQAADEETETGTMMIRG